MPPSSEITNRPPPRSSVAPVPAVEFILAGNGPGELQGWIAPVARAARALVPASASDVKLTLALSPTQFAGGRERDVAQSWGLFDRILDPAAAVRVSLGLERCAVRQPGVLVHLGGDLLLSARLAAQLRVAACAFAETMLVAGRYRRFRRIFAATDSVARELIARGVPKTLVVVTGDPRGDALAMVGRSTGLARSGSGAPVISYLPGSRDRFFAIFAPFFLETVRAVAQRIPDVRSQFIISEFLTPSLVADVAATAQAESGGPAVQWITEEGWKAVARSDFAVTIPGTNTLELAMAAVPFAVLVPTLHLARLGAPLEGALEWVARLPGLGAPLRRAGLRAYLRKERYVAIPNKRAGRAIVPEWIGPLQPADVAARVMEILADGDARAAMAASLRDLNLVQPGAAQSIVREALRVAMPPTPS